MNTWVCTQIVKNILAYLATLNIRISYCCIHQVHASTWHVPGIHGEAGLERAVRWPDSAQAKSRNMLWTNQIVTAFRQLALHHRRTQPSFPVSFAFLLFIHDTLFQDRWHVRLCLCKYTLYNGLIENCLMVGTHRKLVPVTSPCNKWRGQGLIVWTSSYELNYNSSCELAFCHKRCNEQNSFIIHHLFAVLCKTTT